MDFTDGETFHFLMGDNGELYIVHEETASWLAEVNKLGSAVIERVDPETNTVFFSAPLPERLRR